MKDKIDQFIEELCIEIRNSALESAAKVARIYDAPEEACRAILRLKADEKVAGDN